ncbi:hypothetical protein BC629DRAFT_1599826 [Irpex lacteus]|nr:hypothetical protein BC629DRAFT_1599826 [Irpex lacteus]
MDLFDVEHSSLDVRLIASLDCALQFVATRRAPNPEPKVNTSLTRSIDYTATRDGFTAYGMSTPRLLVAHLTLNTQHSTFRVDHSLVCRLCTSAPGPTIMDRRRGIAQKVDANSIFNTRLSMLAHCSRLPVSTHVDLETWFVTGGLMSSPTMFASRHTVRWHSHIYHD